MAAEVKKVEAEKAVAEEPKKEIPEEKKAEEKAVVPAAPAPDEKALVVSESKKKNFPLHLPLCALDLLFSWVVCDFVNLHRCGSCNQALFFCCL